MAALFDADFLSLLLDPDGDPPIDVDTGLPVLFARERIEGLVADLAKKKSKVIIPTPALGEFLAIAEESGPDYLSQLENHSVFQLEPFDVRAAVEAAAMLRAALAAGNKKSGATGPWQAVKVDRQIVAIAKVLGVERIYSNDGDIRNIAEAAGLAVSHVRELEVPASKTPLLDATEAIASEEPETSVPTELPTEPDQRDS